MQWVELAKEAIFKTLEKMFYTMPELDSSGEDPSYKGKNKITSHIKLSGDNSKIFIVITLSEPSAYQMAADFMGTIVDKIKREDVEDCLKELANMVGGYCLGSAGGKYMLSLPQIGNPEELKKVEQCQSFPLFVLGEKLGEVTVCVL
ncbi:MAG: chemotaxis protein CheX [Thermodesulforhabdaceae bacterium]